MQNYQKILLYVPPHICHEIAVNRAARLVLQSGGAITLVDCIETTSMLPAGLSRVVSPASDKVVAERNSRLNRLAKELRDQEITTVAKLLSGRPSVEITREAVSNGHDLVLMTNDRSTKRKTSKYCGTFATRLLRICPCDVCVINGDDQQRFQRIVAAVDPQTADAERCQLNRKILERGEVIAEQDECDCDVFAAWSVFAESVLPLKYSKETLQSYIEATRSRAQQSLDGLLDSFASDSHRWRVRLVKGEVDRVIPEALRQCTADLLIIGTIARKGLAGMLIGNTAETIIQKCDCSVLVVKSDDFVSPVKPGLSRSTGRESSGSSAEVRANMN